MRPALLHKQPLWTPKRLFDGVVQGGWWDSSDLGTLYQHSDKTTPVSAVNDLVGYWGDKSGRNNHMLQVSESPDRRPSYQGNSGIQLTESLLSSFSTAAFTAHTSDGLWGVVVFNYTAGAGTTNKRIISTQNAGLSTDFGATDSVALILREGNTDVYNSNRNSGTGNSQAFTPGAWSIVESRFDGANRTMTVNGTSSADSASTGNFAIAYIYIGINGTGGAKQIDGYMREAIVVTKNPSFDERRNCIRYLKRKWGI